MKSLLAAATGKPRNLTAADERAIQNAARQQFLSELQELEDRAHRLGMTITGHALNKAKNAAGWEIAGKRLRSQSRSRRTCWRMKRKGPPHSN